jgi:AraC-like DNA-binding protein
MSPRNFACAFAAETGMTPAKAIEHLRLEAARAHVEDGGEPIDRVAAATGFGDLERMRRAFIRSFGQPGRPSAAPRGPRDLIVVWAVDGENARAPRRANRRPPECRWCRFRSQATSRAPPTPR